MAGRKLQRHTMRALEKSAIALERNKVRGKLSDMAAHVATVNTHMIGGHQRSDCPVL